MAYSADFVGKPILGLEMHLFQPKNLLVETLRIHLQFEYAQSKAS